MNEKVNTSDILSRLARAEANDIRLHEDVSGLYRKMDNFSESIRRDIQGLAERFSERGRVQPAILIASVLAFITVMSSILAPIVFQVVENERGIEMHTAELSERAREFGINSERLKALETVSDDKLIDLLLHTNNNGELDIAPEYVELSLDIECNSMCVQCNRSSSTAWKNNTEQLIEMATHRVIKADFRTRYNYDETVS